MLVLTRRLEAAANEEEVEKEEEVKDEEEEMAGFSKSPYLKISIPRKNWVHFIKNSNFSRFYKKLGPFYKKLRCDKFGN